MFDKIYKNYEKQHKELFKGKQIGIILTGGNVDLKKFADWFND